MNDLEYLINKVLNSPDLSEEELNVYIDQLLLLSPDPNIVDYIFWDGLSLEQIIEKVMSYKAIPMDE